MRTMLVAIRSAAPPFGRVVLSGTIPATATLGAPFTFTPTTTGGKPPITYSATGLPAGLSIDRATGEVAGNPSENGTFSITITARDVVGQRAQLSGSVTVEGEELSITGTLLNGAVGFAYSSGLSRTGGVGSITWSLSSGSLPAWATLNTSSGVISGTPTGTFSGSITLRATDSIGQFADSVQTLTIGTLWDIASLSPSLHATPETAVTNVSGFASQWIDSSGNAFHFDQANAARRPQIIANALNGYRGLKFNGNLNNTNSSVMRSSLLASQDILRNVGHGWAAIVYKKTAADGSPVSRTVLRVNDQTGASVRLNMNCGSGASGKQNTPTMAAARVDGASPASIIGTEQELDWTVMLSYADYSGNTEYLYINGELIGTASIAATGGNTSDTRNRDGVVIGGIFGDGTAATGYSDMTLLHVAVKGGGSLTADQRDRISASLAWKYGLTASLDSGSPYKLEPPLA